MASQKPVAVFGLEVPTGEELLTPVNLDFPATIRITMAALDPTEEAEPNKDGNVPNSGRSTLYIVKQRMGMDDSDDEDEDEYLQALMANGEEDSEEDSEDSDNEDDEPNGGPSDPSKSKKARQDANLKKLLEATQDDDSDEEMDDGEGSATKLNGIKTRKKGKEPATDEDEDEDSEDDDGSDDNPDLERFVVCTLDTDRNYQQPLDITVGENEQTFFIVSGSHTVHLTGNYVIDDEEEDSDSDEDEGYDLSPDLEELLGDGDESMSDELDEIEHVERIKEIDTDDEVEAPKLVNTKKGKKRPAEEDEMQSLDDLIAKESKAEEPKLSKKQLKKLKNNKGEAVNVEEAAKGAVKEASTPKSDKKVQFAKNLEQGPTGSAKKAKSQQPEKATLGKKVVEGVTIDDRKLGDGRATKAGDKVTMRYIGKLESNNKVFDSNKKGAPFSFTLGKGEVIKGWDIGVAGMSVGGERRLIIPASQAYGNRKMDGIPANSTLVFDVKLLSIK